MFDAMEQPLTRRSALALGAAAMFARPALAAAEQPVIVELFTSQGCSSCPKADAYLKSLRDMPGVVVLSYHVDYWDYLGWRDTLGGPEYSQRQYDYAKSRDDGNVYTPQLVINGGMHYVASKRSVVSDAIDAALVKDKGRWVDVTMADNSTDVMINVGSGDQTKSATLWLLAYAPSISTAIEKGENAGRTIEYYNVVRKMVPAGMWHGEESKIVLPKSSVIPEDCKGWVALLQEGTVGPVIGVATGGIASHS
jgi:hypothetical protein